MHNRLVKNSLVFVAAIIMIACRSNHFVIDKAHMLDDKERKNIEQLLDAYHKRTSCSVYLYSIEKLPDNEDASSYAKEISRTLDLNKNKLDNSAVIFIAAQDRQVILQPEYGLEWQIDAGISELIVRDLDMYFGQGLYKEGIFRAVNQIIALTSKLSWKIKPYNAENVKTQNIIELKNFRLQKSSGDSIVVSTNNSDTITLYITKYMPDLVKGLQGGNGSSAIIYYRPVVKEEGKGNLINIVEK